jgi:hypothetical protein
MKGFCAAALLLCRCCCAIGSAEAAMASVSISQQGTLELKVLLTTSSISTGVPSKQIMKLLLDSPWCVQVLPAPTPNTTTSRDITYCG